MFTELVCQRLMQKEVTVTDGSAMLTGVLLALNLPVTLPCGRLPSAASLPLLW